MSVDLDIQQFAVLIARGQAARNLLSQIGPIGTHSHLLFELLAIRVVKLMGTFITPLVAPLNDSILHKWDLCFKMLWGKQWIIHYLLVSQHTLRILLSSAYV